MCQPPSQAVESVADPRSDDVTEPTEDPGRTPSSDSALDVPPWHGRKSAWEQHRDAIRDMADTVRRAGETAAQEARDLGVAVRHAGGKLAPGVAGNLATDLLKRIADWLGFPLGYIPIGAARADEALLHEHDHLQNTLRAIAIQTTIVYELTRNAATPEDLLGNEALLARIEYEVRDADSPNLGGRIRVAIEHSELARTVEGKGLPTAEPYRI